MKNRKLLNGAITVLAPLALALGVFVGLSKPISEETKGYDAASLPTTIDLNDTSASTIRSYYSSLNNLKQSERQGTNLLKNLKTILKNGQKYFSYENGTDVWRMYEITDRDWEKSPASSTQYGTYNASSNTITNYSYGSSASSSKNNPYIHALYINRDVDNQTKAWGNHNQDEWGINREHVWAKAEGFDSSGAGGARGDPMHLMAGNGYVNNKHSNLFFGYVDTSTSYFDCGSTYSNQSGNLTGVSKTLNKGKVFEAQDCDKGDIARSIFYMVARYNYLSGSDSDGIDSNNPNLTLTQNTDDWASSGYTCSTTNPGKMGIMTDLLAWHHADPVDEFEIHRNNLLYTNFTNNRNPFIDFPEWADFIWGSVNYNGSTYISNDTTPTGYATPSSDTINGYNGGGSTDPVAVTGVYLNKDSSSIVIGESEVLSATVSPSNATNQSVTWSSSDTSVATVSSSGRISALAEGSTTITVTTADGGFTASCSVNVISSGGGGGEVSSAVFKLGDDGDASHADGSGAETYSETQSGVTLSIENGVKMYTGARDAKGNGCLKFGTSGNVGSFTINLSSVNNLTKVILRAANYKATTGTILTVDNGTPSTLTSQSNNGQYDEITVNITNQISLSVEFSARAMLNEIEFVFSSSSSKILDSISIDTSDVETSFYMNDEFDYSGLSVTANYEDGTSELVTNYSVSAPDMSSAGQKTVTVSYTEGETTKTATYEITVLSTNLDSISISNPKTSYYVNDALEKPTVTASYSNGKTSDVTEETLFTGYNMANKGEQTVTVSYSFNGVTKSLSYQITVVEMPAESGTESNPYTVEQARAAITAAGGSSLSNKYTKGIICQIDSYNSTYHSITYWISDDGTTAVRLEVYSGKGIGGADFSSASDLSVGDIVVVVGELKKFNDIFEYNYNNQIVSRIEGVSTSDYSLITNPSELLTGDEIIFTNSSSSSFYTMWELDNNHMAATSISKTDDLMTKNTNTMTFTIVKTSEGFRFKNSSNEYLAWVNGSQNYSAFETESSLSEKSLFNITYSSGRMSVVGVSDGGYSSPRNSLKFYNRSGSCYFSFYSATSTGTAYPSIYKKVTQVYADKWSNTFLSSTENCVVSSWDDLESSYNELALTVKQEIMDCEANASLFASLRSQAMARYEYILSDPRFNTGLANFINGRNIIRESNSNILNSHIFNDSNSITIIVAIATLSVSSISILLIIKKRKTRLN